MNRTTTRLIVCLLGVAFITAAGHAYAQSSLGIGTNDAMTPTTGLFAGFLNWVNLHQQRFYHALAEAIKAMRQDGSKLWLLIGLSFLYCIFHAAGPGNGPQGYNASGAEVITPSAIVHNTAGGYWEVTFTTSSFSGFFAHTNQNGSPLPVTLAKVTATNLGAVNRIDWLAMQETKGDEYVTERSSDGKLFSAIGSVKARGEAGSGYSLTDNAPFNGLNYYRIKVQSVDGSSFYSKVVQALVSNSQLLFTATPNPVREELTVTLSGGEEGTLLLMDMSGRQIREFSIQKDEPVRLPMHNLTPGLYLLTYRQGNISQTIKVMKQ